MAELSQLLRKVALFGIGTVALSQEKIEEFVQEMVKEGEINKEEGKKFVLEILAEKNRRCKEFEDRLNTKIKSIVDDSGIAKKEDVENLSERMDKIETSINKLKQI
jgi:polyhydroxyalkanoate synthesis regulator phasin